MNSKIVTIARRSRFSFKSKNGNELGLLADTTTVLTTTHPTVSFTCFAG